MLRLPVTTTLAMGGYQLVRPMEYVVGEMKGQQGAPIYGMLAVEERLKSYTTLDGVTMSGTLTGPPEANSQSGFERSGEWVVTYETFRDLGLAFASALALIFILLVWEFGNLIHPAIIMAPIPLTLIVVPLGCISTSNALVPKATEADAGACCPLPPP